MPANWASLPSPIRCRLRVGPTAQPLDSVRLFAPQAFRARQYRAVLPADFDDAAEPAALGAERGTAFRWTGSWLTVFTTADAIGSETIAIEERPSSSTCSTATAWRATNPMRPTPISFRSTC